MKKSKKFKFRKEDIPYYILTSIMVSAAGIYMITNGYFRGEKYTINENLQSSLLMDYCLGISALILIPWGLFQDKIDTRNNKKPGKLGIVLAVFLSIGGLILSVYFIRNDTESLNSPKQTEYVCVISYENGNISRGSKKAIRVIFNNGEDRRVTLAGPTYTYGWGAKTKIPLREKVRLVYSKDYQYGSVTKLTGEKC